MKKLLFLITICLISATYAKLPSHFISGTYKGTAEIEKTDSNGIVNFESRKNCELWVDNTDKVFPIAGDYTIFEFRGCSIAQEESEFHRKLLLEIKSNQVSVVYSVFNKIESKYQFNYGIMQSLVLPQSIQYFIAKSVSEDYALIYNTSISYSLNEINIETHSGQLALISDRPISTYQIKINLKLDKSY